MCGEGRGEWKGNGKGLDLKRRNLENLSSVSGCTLKICRHRVSHTKMALSIEFCQAAEVEADRKRAARQCAREPEKGQYTHEPKERERDRDRQVKIERERERQTNGTRLGCSSRIRHEIINYICVICV